jgi:hypothetical protein
MIWSETISEKEARGLMENVQKWGFGMAPLKPSTAQGNRRALVAVKNFVNGEGSTKLDSITEDISKVKGLFNRVIKQDQWDWFTVNMYFDYPTYRDLVSIVNSLTLLRKAIIDKDNPAGEKALKTLMGNNFNTYCENYLSFNINAETPAEYLYILSRREDKDILKIGMTTRNVQKRVNEINSATGVVFPYSARKVYKVKNSAVVERGVHSLLASYRIRVDREFFRIDYAKACSMIEDYLQQQDQYYYG